MKNMMIISILLLATLPAMADWKRPVTSMEVIFACDGMTPNLTGSYGVNINTGNTGVYRLPDGVISFENGAVILGSGTSQALQIGEVSSRPTCTVDDTGEAAHPSWNSIALTPSLKVALSFKTDPTTCDWDPENDAYQRVIISSFLSKSEIVLPE